MDNTSLLSELSNTSSTLQRLLKYLFWILEQSDEEHDMPNIAWDWEMFQEIIYPHYAGSVYSGVLWYGLECLRAYSGEGEDWKIIIPEGTRRELLTHLKQLASKYTKRLKKVFDPEEQDKYLHKLENSVPSQWLRQDWKDILKEIIALQHMEHAIDRLLLLIRLYTRPAPFNSSNISANKVKYYKERLSRFRHESSDRTRNIADAYNLATIENFEGEGDEGQLVENAFLITATTAVNHSGPHLTRDPIYFAISMEMKRQYPDVKSRKKLILAALARIYSLLVRLGELPEQESDSTDLTRRQDVKSFLTGLSNLYDDPVLSELGRLTTRAMKSVENVTSQTRQINTEMISLVKSSGRLGRLSTFLKKVNMVFDGLGEKAEKENYGLTWIKSEEYECNNRYIMRSQNNESEIVMEAEKKDSLLTLRWITEDSLFNFFETFKKLSATVGFTGPVHIFAREYNQPGTKDAIATKISTVPDVIRRIAGNYKLSLLRFCLDQFSLWYEFGELIDLEYTRNPLNLSRIAMRFPLETDVHIIADFFEETSANWYPSKVIAEALDGLRSKDE